MYFVYKFNIPSKNVELVAHTTNDCEALDLVKKCADDFVTEFSREQFDQTSSVVDEKDKKEVTTYAIRKSEDVPNAVDVFKTVIKKTKGWVSSGYDTKTTKIAQFCFAKYDGDLLCESCQTLTSVELPSQSPLENVRKNYTHAKETAHTQELLKELRSSKKFNNRKNNLDDLAELVTQDILNLDCY